MAPVWPAGPAGPQGNAGTAGVNAFGAPNPLSLSLGTAYQASDPTKPASVTINLDSAAGLSLAAGQSNTADVVMGATTGVASGTGSVVGKYKNSLTGTLVIGLGVNTASASPIVFMLPTGYYYAVRQTGGTVNITSAWDQSVG